MVLLPLSICVCACMCVCFTAQNYHEHGACPLSFVLFLTCTGLDVLEEDDEFEEFVAEGVCVRMCVCVCVYVFVCAYVRRVSGRPLLSARCSCSLTTLYSRSRLIYSCFKSLTVYLSLYHTYTHTHTHSLSLISVRT